MKYFINRKLSIKRLRSVAGTNRSVISVTVTGVPANQQNLNPGKTQFEHGLIGKTFTFFIPLDELPISSVKPADKIVESESGKIYTVGSVKTVDFGSTQHIQVEATEEDQ